MDHGLASIESSYGYPLNNCPLKYRFKEKARTLCSSKKWAKLAGEQTKALNGQEREAFLKDIQANSTLLNRSLLFLIELIPEVDVVQLALSEETCKAVRFISATLYMFKEGIEYGV